MLIQQLVSQEVGRYPVVVAGKRSIGCTDELWWVSLPGAPVVEIHVGTVLVMTVLMAAAAALGAVPFFFVGSLSKEWAALANAIACGVMLACSFDLMHEGQPYGGGLVVLGILIGEALLSAHDRVSLVTHVTLASCALLLATTVSNSNSKSAAVLVLIALQILWSCEILCTSQAPLRSLTRRTFNSQVQP